MVEHGIAVLETTDLVRVNELTSHSLTLLRVKLKGPILNSQELYRRTNCVLKRSLNTNDG